MVYDPILNTEVDAESPVTESLMTRMRDNPEAVHAGDATVPLSLRILIPQAFRTNEVDSALVLVPDGVGGVRWSGGGFSGSSSDGIGTAIVNGVYNFSSVAIVAAQVLTGDVTIYCAGDVVISNTINASLYRLRIYAAGNVTINNAVTNMGLEVRCGGNFTCSAAVNTRNQASRVYYLDDLSVAGVFRVFCAGNLSITAAVTCVDCLIYAGGTALISSTIIAAWPSIGATGGSIITETYGASFPRLISTGLERNGGANRVAGGGGGGGGGTGGGFGGAGTSGEIGGLGDRSRSGYRPYLIPTSSLRRGGGGGAGSTGSEDGHLSGGVISIFSYGAATLTGAILIADANGAVAFQSNVGWGGGGTVRVVSRGNIAGGSILARGFHDSLRNGGGGGGGGAFFLASGYSGVQALDAAASGTGGGQGGTTATDTATVSQIDAMIAQGLFNV